MERTRVEGRSDASSVTDGFGDRKKLGRRRGSLGSRSETYLKMQRVTEKRGKWKEVRRKRIGGMRSDWERTERLYTGAMLEWREALTFSELPSTSPIVALVGSDSTDAVGGN